MSLTEPGASPADPIPPRRDRGFASARRAARWRRALREFAVIVAGVLAALGAQAWWQGREERGRERDYLHQLLADTRENERRLDSAIAQDSASGHDAARVASALYAPGPLPPADTLVAWFGGRTFSASDFQPLTGSFTTLLATGDIRLVRNDTLRAALVAYAARLESERENLRFFFEQGFGDPGRLARTLPFVRGVFLDRPQAPESAAVDFGRLRNDPDLASILFAVQAANANRVAHLRGMRDETRRLRRTLEAEPALRRVATPR
jgi:hypothetical protein